MTLEAAIKLLRPDAYAARHKAESERVHSTDPGRGRLPVFAMPGALGPGMPVSLHFFEPRYRRLADRVAGGSRRFLWTPGAPEDATWGSVVEMAGFELLGDGRSLMTGTVAYLARVSEPIMDADEGFVTMAIEKIDEVAVPEAERGAVADAAEALLRAVTEKLPAGAFEQLAERTAGTPMAMPDVREEPGRFSHWLYEVVGMGSLAEEFEEFAGIPAEGDVRVRLQLMSDGVDAVAQRLSGGPGCVVQ